MDDEQSVDEVVKELMKNAPKVKEFLADTPSTISVKDLIDGIMKRLFDDV